MIREAILRRPVQYEGVGKGWFCGKGIAADSGGVPDFRTAEGRETSDSRCENA